MYKRSIINFGLVKVSFRPPTVKVKPFGFLAKTFFFHLKSLVVKNFLPETLTLPGQRSKWPFAPRLLFCCLSQSLSHPLKFIRRTAVGAGDLMLNKVDTG
jgi:hypothetical protein